MSEEDVQALVVDNGSGMCKVSPAAFKRFLFQKKFKLIQNGIV
jgi:hypothetical protein